MLFKSQVKYIYDHIYFVYIFPPFYLWYIVHTKGTVSPKKGKVLWLMNQGTPSTTYEGFL